MAMYVIENGVMIERDMTEAEAADLYAEGVVSDVSTE